MNTDTPETNAVKRPQGLRACADGLDVNPDKAFAQKCMRHAADRMEQLERERDEAREDLKFKEKLCAELTKQLREEQQLHVQTLNERDQWRNEHDRVVHEYQHRMMVIGISVINATSYPENVDVEARCES
jgi:hypothetical protein